MAEGAGDSSGGATGVKPGALTALLQEVAAAPERREDEPLSLPPGTVIGRFEIIRELGRGGFGVVYEARDRDLGRQVAVKLVRPGRVVEEEGKVSREAEAIARLAHPNLITLHEVGRSEHGPFLVFEFLRGKTLQARMDDGPMPVQEAVHVATEIARGLAHAHADGVVHRDLKPSNVFVTNKGQVKILDFGLAHAFGRRRLSGGTPAYMAPEQWEDAPEDERTDVFALGVMLYRMLSGEYPFPEGEGKWAAEGGVPRKLDVPGAPDLADLVEKMLDRNPTHRPRDGAAVLAALTPIEEKLRAKPGAGSPPVQARRRKATFGDLLAELKRRRVFRVVVGYGIFSFAVLQVVEPIMHGAGLPDWVLKAVLVALAVGFPVALILAWLFDLTAQGVIRTPSASVARGIYFSRNRLAALLVVVGILAALPGIGWYAWKQTGERGMGEAPAATPSIAVLPFADMSEKHDQEYFADGVAEEILNELAHLKGLKVIGRTSAFSFKGKNEDLRVVSQKLGVNHVLEGSVRRQGGRIRVTALLIRATDGTHAWSESYERDAADVFAVQQGIAKAVASALQVALVAGAVPSATEGRPRNEEAYNQYLLGLHHYRALSGEGYENAVAAFRNALAIDPEFAPAWAQLGMSLYWLTNYRGDVNGSTRMEEALGAAEKSIALAPNQARGYLVRGLIRGTYQWNWDAGTRDFARALELSPGSPLALRRYAVQLSYLGRAREAVPYFLRATELDPLDAGTWNALGSTYIDLGELELGRKAIERCLAIAPTNVLALQNLGDLNLMQGRPAEALEVYSRIEPGAFRLQGMVMAYNALGRERESREALAELIEKHGATQPTLVADALGWRGEKEEAFRWLERAAARRDSGLRELKVDRYLRSIRGDPRYAALLRRLNLPLD